VQTLARGLQNCNIDHIVHVEIGQFGPQCIEYCKFLDQALWRAQAQARLPGDGRKHIQMANKQLQPTPVLMLKVEAAFLAHGYQAMTMEQLAEACNFSRRALYFYFGSKADALRAVCRFRNDLGLTTGFETGRKRWTAGADALEILSSIINIRYGDTRRIANASPHMVELNTEIFTRCIDIVRDVAIYFETELAAFIMELRDARLLKLRPGVTAVGLARALADGARGVNQRLPPVPPRELATRYRDMCRYVLYGGVETPRKRKPGKPRKARS
jgi:AcrR family transcriptional regulator